MPTKPRIATLTNSSVDIVNAIKNGASIQYKDFVPFATPDADSIRSIGQVIMDNPALQNEFLSALINRIGFVVVSSKMYQNPWAMFKRGRLEFGETIEEIFVNIAKGQPYDVNEGVTAQYQRKLPDVKSAFHILNYQAFYKVTIQEEDLRQAFLSWSGVADLIAKIVDSIYSGANYDEFNLMKYIIAKKLINGQLYNFSAPDATAANAKELAGDFKAISNQLEFMSDKYNLAGVKTHTKKDEQYLIVNASFDAIMDVAVLASAFNMDKAEFMGHRVLIDNFGEIDFSRLDELLIKDGNYVDADYSATKSAITSAKAALNAIPAVIVDRDFFMIFDKMEKFTEKYNGESLYWNYWYHTWKVLSTSPFANAVAFVPSTYAPTVSAVDVKSYNTTLSGSAGARTLTITGADSAACVAQLVKIKLYGEATVSNFGSKAVVLTSGNTKVHIDAHGIITADSDYTITDGGTLVITATSVADGSVTGTLTITYDI